MNQSLTERESKILNILTEDSSASVSDISATLDVSSVTIRSDLSSLAEKGFIVRTRGGAFPAFHQNVLDKQRHRVDVKNRIAKAAADMVNDGDSIIIGAGTTTSLIAKYLLGKRDINVVTNSTLLYPYARINPSINLTVVGGAFRPSTEALVGPIALRELEEFHAQKAFIGTDGITFEQGMTTNLVEAAEVIKKIHQQADSTILIADSSKYGATGFVRILPLQEVDVFVTDSEIDRHAAELIRETGVTMKIV